MLREEKVRDDNIIWSTFIYLATGVFQKAGGFLLLPFLMATLSPGEFSRYGLFSSVLVLFPQTLSLNIHGASTRLIFDYTTPKSRASFAKTVLVAAVSFSCISLLAAGFGVYIVSYQDPVTLGKWSYRAFLFVAVCSTVVIQFGLAMARIHRQAHQFSVLSISKSTGVLLLYLAVTYFVEGTYRVVVFTYGIILFCVALFALKMVWPRIESGDLNFSVLKPSLKFSIPTVVNFLAFWVIGVSGRWIGNIYLPLGQMADYVLLTFLVAGVGIFGRALFDARLPDISEAFAEQEYASGMRIIQSVTSIAVAFVILAYLAVVLVVEQVPSIIPEGYQPDLLLIGIAAVASLLDCLYLYGLQTLRACKQTGMQAISATVSAITVLVLSFVLTPVMGTLGLIVATATGYLVQGLQSVFLSARAYGRLA